MCVCFDNIPTRSSALRINVKAQRLRFERSLIGDTDSSVSADHLCPVQFIFPFSNLTQTGLFATHRRGFVKKKNNKKITLHTFKRCVVVAAGKKKIILI